MFRPGISTDVGYTENIDSTLFKFLLKLGDLGSVLT